MSESALGSNRRPSVESKVVPSRTLVKPFPQFCSTPRRVRWRDAKHVLTTGGSEGRVLTRRTAGRASCPERPRSTSAPRTQNCDPPTQRAHAPPPPRTGVPPLRPSICLFTTPRATLRPQRPPPFHPGANTRVQIFHERKRTTHRGERARVRGTESGGKAGDDGTSTARDQHQKRWTCKDPRPRSQNRVQNPPGVLMVKHLDAF
jgi:hypothetical protein